MHSGEPSGLLPLRPLTFRLTSAICSGWRLELPAKMTSSIDVPRRLLTLCSPSTQLMASEMLLLPQPFGPDDARHAAVERHLLPVAEALEAEYLNGIETHGSQDKPPNI